MSEGSTLKGEGIDCGSHTPPGMHAGSGIDIQLMRCEQTLCPCRHVCVDMRTDMPMNMCMAHLCEPAHI